MHGTQADTGLFGEFALRDFWVFVDQVHHFKVGIGVLGFTFSVHDLHFTTLPPYRVLRSIEKIESCMHCSTLNAYTVN